MSRRTHFIDGGTLARMAYVMAMRIMQSSLYRDLDDEEKAAVDDAIANYLGAEVINERAGAGASSAATRHRSPAAYPRRVD